MQLTKEDLELVLDQKLNERFSKFEQKIDQKLDDRFSKFEQKIDEKFDKQTKELKEFAEEQTDQLAKIIAVTIANPMQEGFKSLNQKLNLNTGRIEKLEKDMSKIKSTLSIN